MLLGKEMVCDLPLVNDACHNDVPSAETDVHALAVPVAAIFKGTLPDVPVT